MVLQLFLSAICTWKVVNVRKVAWLYWWDWVVVLQSLLDILVVEGEEMERGHEILARRQCLSCCISYNGQDSVSDGLYRQRRMLLVKLYLAPP